MGATVISNSAIDVSETPRAKSATVEQFKEQLSQLNVASQKGLIENFDSHVGRTTVLMPLGGKLQKHRLWQA
jgi:hypothetical protein